MDGLRRLQGLDRLEPFDQGLEPIEIAPSFCKHRIPDGDPSHQVVHEAVSRRLVAERRRQRGLGRCLPHHENGIEGEARLMYASASDRAANRARLVRSTCCNRNVYLSTVPRPGVSGRACPWLERVRLCKDFLSSHRVPSAAPSGGPQAGGDRAGWRVSLHGAGSMAPCLEGRSHVVVPAQGTGRSSNLTRPRVRV